MYWSTCAPGGANSLAQTRPSTRGVVTVSVKVTRVPAPSAANSPRQSPLNPAGDEMHRTRAPERAVILMVETAGIIPTGDDPKERTR